MSPSIFFKQKLLDFCHLSYSRIGVMNGILFEENIKEYTLVSFILIFINWSVGETRDSWQVLLIIMERWVGEATMQSIFRAASPPHPHNDFSCFTSHQVAASLWIIYLLRASWSSVCARFIIAWSPRRSKALDGCRQVTTPFFSP